MRLRFLTGTAGSLWLLPARMCCAPPGLPASRSRTTKPTSFSSSSAAFSEEMQAVDVSGVEPMAHAQDVTLRLRDDAVTEADQHALFQSVAPRVERGLYLVPKVIE
jgi:aspartyl/glutamyl-tRNA(Asn/Gln) amidotransferase C subunit